MKLLICKISTLYFALFRILYMLQVAKQISTYLCPPSFDSKLYGQPFFSRFFLSFLQALLLVTWYTRGYSYNMSLLIVSLFYECINFVTSMVLAIDCVCNLLYMFSVVTGFLLEQQNYSAFRKQKCKQMQLVNFSLQLLAEVS